MISFFIKRPATTIVLVAFFVILGIVSYFNLTVELIPKMEFPTVTVTVTYPGATPFEIETQMIKKIEDQLAELSDIKRMTSHAYDSYGYIALEFQIGVDANNKTAEAKDKVEALLNELPEKAEKPLVQKFDPLAMPVVELILSSQSANERDLFEFADKNLKPDLSNIKGVASVTIYGGKQRQINVTLDPVLARQKMISITDVINALAGKNIAIPGGNIEKTATYINIRFTGEFESLDEIKNFNIITGDNQIVSLDEIATITDSYKKVDSMARYNSKPAVGLKVIKSNEANTVTVASMVRENLPEIIKMLPDNMTLTLASDNSEHVLIETNDALVNILLGILLTVIILYIFTGDQRITFIASLIIPTSLISTFFAIDKAGFSINIMTLIATAMALGTLIANAIVVIESILKERESGLNNIEAAEKGTKKVAVAVLASAGTNLVVFTPIAFVGGITGMFMKQFGLTVVFATLFSLLASFSLTPMLCALLLKKKSDTKKRRFSNKVIALAQHVLAWLLAEYKIVFDKMFQKPKTTLTIIFVVIFAAFGFVRYIGNEFMPHSDNSKIIAKITMPQSSRIEQTQEVVKQVEALFQNQNEVKGVVSQIGENGVENASVSALLVPIANRTRSDIDIINSIIPKIVRIPEAEIHLIRGQVVDMPYGDVTINVYGKDMTQMRTYADKINNIFVNSGFFRDTSISDKGDKDEIRFIPNQHRLIRHGVSDIAVASTLRAAINGDTTNTYKENGEEYDINVELDKDYLTSINDMAHIGIISSKGLLPLTELGTITKQQSLSSLSRRDRKRIIQINGYLTKSTAGVVMSTLEPEINKINFDKGYSFQWVGKAEDQSESNKELFKAFILAIILTVMVLIALLNSFLHPITIGTSIITSFSGVFFMMFFTGASFNIASLLAIIMLVGLVINNAILMLDATMQKLNHGADIKTALWEGISDKFRAILMTSVAIIFGVIPQLTSHDVAKYAMGSVLIGGMLASILFTFFLTPLVFWYLERAKALFIKNIVSRIGL